MATDRYQRGLDRMMELVSAGHSNTFDHVTLAESYKAWTPGSARGDAARRDPWTQAGRVLTGRTRPISRSVNTRPAARRT